ncbi:uncharacterized protein LTR77_009942 [Saxophila tyrrhenica]|uniref:PEBP-like protein n=1 Tax=Saxophila tyrrhenica TaxID=1690608 RepID=A0AAV9NX48_9PEZI|nr:hypothetical protein LTR77_009942 [Saxophila tyrrhenica]
MATVEAALAFVQTSSTPKLTVSFDGKVVGNGEHIPKAETHVAPTVSLTSPGSDTYLALCVDLDAPFISFPFLSPILHWLQPGLRAGATSSSESGATELTASDTPYVFDYRGAGPPPGAAPHRYVFLLYRQPEGFEGKVFGQPDEGQKVGLMKRVRYDFGGLVARAGLGEPVAGSWVVSN